MSHLTRNGSWIASAALLALAAAAAGQTVLDGTDRLDFDRPEAWAMKYFTSVTQMSGLGAPRRLDPGALELGFESGWVPSLSEGESTVGFIGFKAEDLNRTDVFGRLRLTVGLPHATTLTLGWVPPVEVDGAEPNLFSLALGRQVYESDAVRLGLRLHGQLGKIKGDFTCPRATAAAGDDPVRNPFDCHETSHDALTPAYVGLELTSAFPLGGSRVEPYVAASLNYQDMKFRVDARWSEFIDHTLQLADGFTYSLAAGASFPLGERFAVVGEAFYAPLEVVRPPRTKGQNDELLNVRAMLRYTLR